MSKVDEQEVFPTKLPEGEYESASAAKAASVNLPRQLLSATRIVQLLPDRTRTRKGLFSHPEPKKNLQKNDQIEESTSPKAPSRSGPVIATEDETIVEVGEAPTTISEGRPKRNTPRLHRFIEDFAFLLKQPTTPKKSSIKPILDENGIPMKRKRGRPSNRERLEAELLASQRMGIRNNMNANDRSTDNGKEIPVTLTDPNCESTIMNTPKENDAVLQRPKQDQDSKAEQGVPSTLDASKKKDESSYSQEQKQSKKSKMQAVESIKEKPKSGNDHLSNPGKENECEQPPKRKRGRPRKHPLPETPNVPGGRSKSLPVLPGTPSSKQKNGKNSFFGRKSLPQNSILKHRKIVTIADLITESESTDKSDREDSVITSADEQTDTTFRASSVRLGPMCTTYHSVLNPLPGFVDAITCAEVVRPAISPYGHVLSWETWIKVLCFGDPKNVCPFTKRPLTKRQLKLLDFDNIEEFRGRIQNV